jgi:ankyrin repeat protein
MIIDHKPDVVNVVSTAKHTTPLALACQPNLHAPGIDEYKPDHKPEQFVALLLDSRADVRIRDDMGRTALHHVANESDWNALEGRADRTGAAELIEMVLKNNPDVDAIDTLGKTALMLACSKKHSKAVRALLAGGASVNLSRPEGTMSGATDKTTALMYAVEGTNYSSDQVRLMKDPIVPLLLARNADPNAENPANETALTLAARRNSPRDIEYLVQAGARVNQVDYGGKTPMHHLARWKEDDRPGTADAIRLLSQHDANPDAQDNNGCSPLIIAARESNCQEVVRALLEAAADRTLVDGEGKTALMYAKALQRSGAILRMLRGEIE